MFCGTGVDSAMDAAMVESIGIPHDVEEISTFTEPDDVKRINKAMLKCFPGQCCGTEDRDDSERTFIKKEIVNKEDPLYIELDRSKWFDETKPMLWTRVYDDSALYAKLRSNVPETPRVGPRITNDDDIKNMEVLWTRVLDDSSLYEKLSNRVQETHSCGPQEEDIKKCKTEEFLWTRVLDDNALYTKLKSSIPEAPRCGPTIDDVPEAPRCGPLENPRCGPPETPPNEPVDFNDDDIVREELVENDLIADDIVASKQTDDKESWMKDQFACVPKVHVEVNCNTADSEDKNIIASEENIDPIDPSEEDDVYCEDEGIETDWESAQKTLSPKKGPHLRILERISKERQIFLERQKEIEEQKKEKKRKKEIEKQKYTRSSIQLQSRLEKIYNREQKIRSMDMKLGGFKKINSRKTSRPNVAGPSDVSTTVSGKTGKTGVEVLRMNF